MSTCTDRLHRKFSTDALIKSGAARGESNDAVCGCLRRRRGNQFFNVVGPNSSHAAAGLTFRASTRGAQQTARARAIATQISPVGLIIIAVLPERSVFNTPHE